MSRAVAINVAANTNEPGFRGPVYPNGAFVYVPIPESEPTLPPGETPTGEAVPTYGDLDLPFSVPSSLENVPVHADPEFPGVHGGERATYGDPHGVKARPISALAPGDILFFYATLTLRPAGWRGPNDDRDGTWLRERATGPTAAAGVADDLPPDWGAYLIGGMRIEEIRDDPERGEVSDRFGSNAHLKRDPFDARVLVRGDPDAAGLFDRAVPLSGTERGVDANRIVTSLSADSGRGPWWRRPLRFDEAATDAVLDVVSDRAGGCLVDAMADSA